MDDSINMLESDNQALRLAIKDLQSAVQDSSINNACGVAVSKTVLLPGNADKYSKKTALASLAAVHAEMADKQKRAKNVIVSGLLPSTADISDAELFANLCGEYLSAKPSFRRESFRRFGKPLPSRIQPLLVTLDSQSSVADLLCSAPALRHCEDLDIKNSVFINADLTPAEAFVSTARGRFGGRRP